jgi:flagellar motor switch protein FliM
MTERRDDKSRPWQPSARRLDAGVKRWLDAWASAAAQRLAAELRRATGKDVSVKVDAATESMPPFRDLLDQARAAAGARGADAAATLRAEGWQSPAVAFVTPELTHLAVELLLGGGNSSQGTQRGRGDATTVRPGIATTMSRRLLQRFLALAAGAFSDSIKPDPTLRCLAVSPVDELPRVMGDGDACATISLKVTGAGTTGSLLLAVPAAAAERAMKRAQSGEGVSAGAAPGKAMSSLIAGVDVDVVACLGSATLTARAVAELKVGDVVRLDKSASTLVVEGRAKFQVELAPELHGMKTVRIAKAS